MAITQRVRDWLNEVLRNNTVVTLDVTGSYGPGRDVPLILDARNADKLNVSIYRVAKAEELQWVADRIGEDFIYRDYGLQYVADPAKILRDRWKEALKDEMAHSKRDRKSVSPMPPSLQREPLHRWSVEMAKLPHHADRERERRRFDEDDDSEAQHFDDECDEHRERLDKRYRPEGRSLSSWQCDRLLIVPGHLLREAGAYVVAVEANGQTAYAPLMVDPLSLSLKRCRDGVFAAVHDIDGFTPLVDVRVTANGILREVRTDAAGVAFAKVFAAGDRAIIAEKDGRFAIGGFGRVFEGVYRMHGEDDWHREAFDRIRRAEERILKASIYDDRLIVAALTDRPTYRPGQEVHFKLIVRKYKSDEKAEVKSERFRADDFEPPGGSLRFQT